MKLENLKFRKWHRDSKHMTYSYNQPTVDVFLWIVCRYPDMYELMPFTGLKDKRGKDIYEGDIIKFCNNEDMLYTVIFEFGCFCLKSDDEASPLNKFAMPLIEVVGNIYELGI